MANKENLRIALSVLSGRRTDLTLDELRALGFDPHKLDYFSESILKVVRERAEEILYDLIMEMDGR
jgi:hypothetical protein